MRLMALSLFICLGCSSNFVQTKEAKTDTASAIIWHWEDDFSEKEKEKLILYFTEVTDATFKVLGEYPFKVHYFIHRSDSDKEPIPWAHTERSEVEAVHFYVCADFDLGDFRADWTAPHEISHLSIPFLGKENAWFSEGYATYMQLQILKEMGVYTADEMAKRYVLKDELVAEDFAKNKPFLDEVKSMRAQYNYPAMYWGSVRYFRKINEQLTSEEQISLAQHIKSYQKTNRLKDESFEDLIQSLDVGLKKPIFKQLFDQCCKESFFRAFE